MPFTMYKMRKKYQKYVLAVQNTKYPSLFSPMSHSLRETHLFTYRCRYRETQDAEEYIVITLLEGRHLLQ